MSARIRGAKTELEELGEETDAYTESTSKLQGLVKGLTGFDILEEDGQTFKDIYEIILGIGEAWSSLTDVEQASLGEALAGKRSANALYAVLGNLDTLKSAYQTAEESAGSAMREQERYEQSVQYSIDRMNASLESLANTFLDSKFLKGFVDFGNDAINVVETLIEKFGVLPTLLTTIGVGFGAFKSFKGEGKWGFKTSSFQLNMPSVV